MGWQPWGDIGSFMQGVASLLALASLFYILKQTREMNRQNALTASAAVASAYSSIATTTIDIDRLFLENPDLAPFFFENVAIDESHCLYKQAMSVAEMLVDYWDLVWVLRLTIPSQVRQPWMGNKVYQLPWDGWREYFVARYSTSPAIRRFWAEKRRFYLPTLEDVLGALPNEYLQ